MMSNGIEIRNHRIRTRWTSSRRERKRLAQDKRSAVLGKKFDNAPQPRRGDSGRVLKGRGFSRAKEIAFVSGHGFSRAAERFIRIAGL